MQELLGTISRRLTTEYAGRARVLTLNDVFGCLSGYVITNLALARSYHLVDSEKWESPFTTVVNNLVHISHWAMQFEWLLPTMNLLPNKLVKALAPIMAPIIDFRLVSRGMTYSGWCSCGGSIWRGS
jgi:hypothetical protein